MKINTDIYLRKTTALADYITAFQSGEMLESYDATREIWVKVIDENLEECLQHFMTTAVDDFWDLRIAPKPEPKIPDGVFWVRFIGELAARLVIEVDSDNRIRVHNGPWVSEEIIHRYEWSRDRKTWYKFTETEVSS